MVDARRVDGLLDVHAVVDHVDDRLQRDGMMGAAGVPITNEGLPVFRDDRRAHR